MNSSGLSLCGRLQWKKRCFKAIRLAMYLLFDHNRAFPQEYEASGIFRSEDYSPQYAVGKPARIIEGSFFVSVRGCQSFVEYRVTNAVSHSEFLKTNEAGCILAFDGINYYQLPVTASNLIPN